MARKGVNSRSLTASPYFSRPIIPILLTLLAGVVLGAELPGQSVAACLIAGIAALHVLYRVFRKSGAFISPLILLFALGYLSLQSWIAPNFPQNHIIHLIDRGRFVFMGTVVSRSGPLPRGFRYVVDVGSIEKANRSQPVVGRIRLTVTGDNGRLLKGDQIRFPAKIRAIRNFNNPGAYDYRRQMLFLKIYGTAWVSEDKLQGIPSRPRHAAALRLDHVRNSLMHWIMGHAPEDAGAVLSALLVGIKTHIDQALRDDFNRCGIGHLLAISGLHIGIVATLAFFVFKWLLSRFPFFLMQAWTRKGAALLTVFPVLAYGMIAGMSPSTQRAVIMAIVVLSALLVEREQDIINTLAIAALLIVIIDPPSVFSISFQLSFAAVLAIVFIMGLLSSKRPAAESHLAKVKIKLILFFAGSLTAILGTLPLVMLYFNQTSTIGLMTNFIFIPLIGFCIVPLGLVALLLKPVWAAAAHGLIALDAALMTETLKLIRIFAHQPFSAIKTFTPSTVEIIIYYIFFWAVAILLLKGKKSAKKIEWRAAKVLLVTAILAISLDALYWIDKRAGAGDLEVSMIDVGQGTSALITFPTGSIMLVDGGGFSDNRIFDVGAWIIAPYLWRNKILSVDEVVLTHPNSDHLNGLLFILEHFNVKTVWTNGQPSDTFGYERFRQIIANKGITNPRFRTLQRTMTKEGVQLAFLYPLPGFLKMMEREAWRNRNNNSLVLRLGYGSVSFLFPGDVMAKAETEMVRLAGPALKSTVLFVPHHGSRTSSTAAFLSCVKPKIAAISTGWKNRFHFPHTEVIRRYQDRQCRIFRTDLHGAVRFKTNGKRVEIQPMIGRRITMLPSSE